MRERAGVRADHAPELRHNTPDNTWWVACACGWGASSGHERAVKDWHTEHVADWMRDAAATKRADQKVQAALLCGDTLTRERYATADAAVICIAPLPGWVQYRPGATAHRMSHTDPTSTLCGRYLTPGTALVAARAYTRRCPVCVRISA